MRRRSARILLIGVVIVCAPIRAQPARWWRSPDAIAALGLTPAECDEIEQLYRRSVPAQQAASVEAAQALNAIARQLDDHFVEERLLALTERLAAAQGHAQAVERDLSHRARAVCARRHMPDWLITRVAR